MYTEVKTGINKLLEKLNKTYKTDEKLVNLFKNGMSSTLENITKVDDDSYFILTGDIEAMWLRDSSAQIRPLLFLVNENEQAKEIVKGIINKQKEQILIDPYANAFNISASGLGHHDDDTEMSPWLWERKFEVDSLCYPIELAYLYSLETNDYSIFDQTFLEVMKTIINVFKIEQDHESLSKYRFVRTNPGIMQVEERHKYETLQRNGLGTPVKPVGLIWGGFRPSDDASQYGYLIPSNMFAVVVMKYMLEIIEKHYPNQKNLYNDIEKVRSEVNEAIKKYGIISHEKYGDVYAYEVDGFGNYLLMDDANVPSLLSAPYLGFCDINDQVYQNTRRLMLSFENPFYFEGEYAKGIGSPHTPENHIWHISLAIQGLTSTDEKEKALILHTLKTTDADTNLMHEGFNVNDPFDFSRESFSWANSMFALYLLHLNGYKLKGEHI